jgi:hypothetical protein
MISLQPVTGDWIAPLRSQEAWASTVAAPWVTIFDPQIGVLPYMTRIEQAFILGALVLAIWAMIRLPSKAPGIYVLLLIAAMLATGQILDATRYVSTAFPVFIMLALLGRHPMIDRLILIVSAATLALLMAAWSRFYWVA